MRNSYIAKDAEALNLHNGTQTAIVVGLKQQPIISDGVARLKNSIAVPNEIGLKQLVEKYSPYALGQEVYVREAWGEYPNAIYTIYFADYPKDATNYLYPNGDEKPVLCDLPKKRSSATMPKSAARTRFKIVSCEAVRVKDLKGSPKAFEDFCKQFGIKKIPLSKPYGVNKATHAYSLVDMQGRDEFLYENCLRDYYGAFGYYIAKKLGNNTWDNNDYIWYYKIDKL
jgi:hypothetical protein